MEQAVRKATPLAQSPSKSGGIEVSKDVGINVEGIVDEGWQLAGCLVKVGGFWTGKAGAGPNLSKILWRSWLLDFCWFNKSLSFCPMVGE